VTLLKRPWFAAVLLALAILAVLGSASTRSHAARATPPANGTCVTGTIAGYPSVSCLNKTWHCTTRQRHTQVHVTIKDAPQKLDGIHVDAGCTGFMRVTVVTDGGDGLKLHTGAHDLEIWGGPVVGCQVDGRCAAVLCTAKYGQVHQDGVQAMGGRDIRLMYFKVWCPSGNNGGIFFNGGKGGNGVPTNVVCWWCDLMEGNAAFNIGPGSNNSGVRFSRLHTGRNPASPANCRRIDKTAVSPVDIENTCLTPK
jgi:hypothetical protein